MKQKLQTNVNGSWRNFIAFDESNSMHIKAAAKLLGAFSENRISFRIVSDRGVVLEHCLWPNFEWSEWEGES